MWATVTDILGDWRHLIDKPVFVTDLIKTAEKGSIPAFGCVAINRVLVLRSLLTIVIGTLVIITMAFFVSELIGWKLVGCS